MRRTSRGGSRASEVAVRAAVAAWLALLGSAAQAEFEASIDVGISHTDNVFLSPPGEEVDDMVFTAAPHIDWSYESRSLDADLNYNYSWFKYDEVDTDSSYHYYEASITPKLGDDAFTMEIGANRSQVITDPDQVIPPGRLPLVNNLTDQDEYFANPIFNLEFGSSVTLNLDYRYSMIQYNDATIQDNDNQQAAFDFNNYRRGRGLTWALKYNWYKTEYEVSDPWEYNFYAAELGFWVSNTVRLFGSGGRESQWDDLVDRSPKDNHWEAGFAVTSGERLNIEVAAGERSFGPSWRASVDYTFRRGTTRLEYKETPTTIGNNQETLPGSLNPDDPNDYLTQPGSGESFLQSRFEWSLELEFRRTNFDLLVYDEARDDRVDENGLPLNDQAQRGVDASLSWDLGVRTELVLGGSFAERENSELSSSDFVRAKLTVNYDLGSHTRLSLIYDHSVEDPQSGSASLDYTANVASLIFTYTF